MLRIENVVSLGSILLALLVLPAFVYADPFSSTTTTITVLRQSLHDGKAKAVATTKPLVVRYNPNVASDCFILSSSGDIPCGFQPSIIGIITPYGEIYPPEMVVAGNDFLKLIGDLNWTDTSYKTEFSSLAPSARVFPVFFDFSKFDYAKDQPGGTLVMESIEVTSPDGKVIYSVE
jgi:hypothetical protein